MADMIKMGLKLLIITAVAALGLGLTNMATAGPIEQQKIAAANEARQAVLPEAEEFEILEIDSGYSNQPIRIEEIYAGKSGGETVGYTFRVLSKGYGGDISIIAGIDTEGKIVAIEIGEMSETPGLGAKAAEEKFISQYRNKTADTSLEVVKGKTANAQQIQAISGATITSRAVTNGVNTAIEYYNEFLRTGGES